MKKIYLYLFLFLGLSSSAFSQVFTPDSSITGHITNNVVLSPSKTYLLVGWVYVDSLSKITIPAGTKIFGDKGSQGALIIKRGAQIFAQGTATNPIIFTSTMPPGFRAPGDWGGLIICGSASTNQGTQVKIEGGPDAFYGGSNDSDNSGIIRYVRIEFAGIAFQPNSEINGLTMGGVGDGTSIDHVQVSYSGDDGFEWFGGTVNCKYLISFRSLDDDFDTDFGFRGKVQFGFCVRDPFLADQSKSEAFESDNNAGGDLLTPRTQPVFSNFTLIGPKQTSTSVVHPNFFYGVHERRSTLQSIHNSVFTGWPSGGMVIDGNNVAAATTNDTIKFKRNIIAGSIAGGMQNVTNGFIFSTWFNTAGYGNQTLTEPTDVKLRNPYNPVAPNLTPNSDSPLLGLASFADLTDPFWTPVTYAGAFGNDANRWDAGWTNFDPQSNNYNTNIAWSSSIKVINSLDENRYVVFGRGTGASDGIDASFGETSAPSQAPNSIDARWILPSSDETILDIRATGIVASDSIKVYKLQVNPGDGTSLKISWDPNYLGGGSFYLSDSLYSGAFFSLTNMKTTSNVTFAAAVSPNTNYIVYIYVYTKIPSVVLSVSNGWNMVSVPGFHPSNNNPSTLFADIIGSPFSFNGSYVTASTLTPGTGYWAKINGARVYTFNNAATRLNYSPKTSTPSNIGWNIVGVFDYNVNVTGLTTVPSNSKTGLVFNYTPGTGYNVASIMEVGKAYWVRVTTAGQIILPGIFSGVAKASDNIVNENWGKIIITDATGKNYTLYSAKEGIDFSRYEMPPLPPAEMFDARFGSQRFVEDLSTTQTINFTGVSYPVKIRVQGLSLSVSDLADGSIVKSTLKDGEELVINNSGVNALKVSSSELLPDQYILSQNYPNPFNPSTKIKFSVPQAGNVQLIVFNAIGQKVAVLANGMHEAGTYSINFDATNLSSGIYFYQIKTDNFSSIKKMIFLK